MSYRKIILINQSTGYLTIDIANALAEKYDEVVLLYGSLKLMDIDLSAKIKHARLIRYNRKSTFSRIFTWLYASVQIFFKLLFVYRKHEIMYVTNPPMSYFASCFFRRRFSIIVYDIYPDALKNIGIRENSFVYKIWDICNKKIFVSAHKIFTLSDGMQNCLVQYVPRNKIVVIPNWSHLSDITPIIRKDNPFILNLKLEKKFIVLYSGNIGYTHNLEVVIEAAQLISDDNDIVFMFIGDGAKKKKLQQMTEKYALGNCLFLDWQPGNQFLNALSAADMSVVTLNETTAMLSVPSKTYNLMAVGSPLLAIANKESELAKLVTSYKCGSCFDGNDPREIANYIIMLKKNESLRMQISEYSRVASSHFTKQNALKYVESLI